MWKANFAHLEPEILQEPQQSAYVINTLAMPNTKPYATYLEMFFWTQIRKEPNIDSHLFMCYETTSGFLDLLDSR